MRKYLCVLMSIILCLTVFCSCSNVKTADVADSTNITSSTSSEQTSDISEVTVESTTEVQTTKSEKKKAQKEQSKKETTKKSEKASTTAKSVSKKENKKNTAAKKSGTKAQSKKSNSKANSKAEKSASVSTAKSEASTSKSEHKVTQTTSSEIDCTITIECKSILDNMDDLKKGHESYVPKNGIMLENYKTTLKNGSTVYDLLKTACKNNKITYTAKDTMYSVYIVGINNIDEFDCGKKSGWLYSVNGKYPNVSVDSKKLKDGDKVVFTYTCSYRK